MSEFSGGPKVGHQMKTYRNSGTVETPVWGEIGEIGDVTLDGFELGTAELKRRGNNYTKLLAALFNAFSLNMRYIHGLGGTMFTALRTDFLAKTTRQYAVCNGNINSDGTEGLTFAGLLTAFPWDQPLEDVSGHDVVIGHGYMVEADTEVDPEWLVVEGSA
jgi:hypothetical protein